MKKKFWKKIWAFIKNILPNKMEIEVGDATILIECPTIIKTNEEKSAGFKTKEKEQDEIGTVLFDVAEIKRVHSSFDTYRGKTIHGVVINFYDGSWSPFLPVKYSDFLIVFEKNRALKINTLSPNIIYKMQPKTVALKPV